MSIEGLISFFAAGHHEPSSLLLSMPKPKHSMSPKLDSSSMSGKTPFLDKEIVASKIQAMFLEDSTQPHVTNLISNAEMMSVVGGLFQICHERSKLPDLIAELQDEITGSVRDNQLYPEDAVILSAYIFGGDPLDSQLDSTAE